MEATYGWFCGDVGCALLFNKSLVKTRTLIELASRCSESISVRGIPQFEGI
jgi:hypothetical protein